MTALLRGRVYWTDLGVEEGGKPAYKPCLVVSENRRNQRAEHVGVLAVRITTTTQRVPENPAVTRLGSKDPLVGTVLCEDILRIWPDEIKGDAGALTMETMEGVADSLRFALGLG